MISDESVKLLHDKATRGQKLSVKEQKQLESWYAEQDALEGEALALSANQTSNALLEAQVDEALTQLITVTQQIRKISSENERLRREIAALRRRVVQRIGTQPA